MTGQDIKPIILATAGPRRVHPQPNREDYPSISGVPVTGGPGVGQPHSLLSPDDDQRCDTDGDWQGERERALGYNLCVPGGCDSEEPRWHKQVFSPRQAELQLERLNLRALPFDEDATATANPKEKLQINLWRSMATDMAGGCRSLISGTPERILAVDLVAASAPNFVDLCHIFSQALGASLTTRTPLNIPPILLLGPPGIGKSHICAAIANALATEVMSMAMTTTTSVNPLGGTDMVWRSPRVGLVAKALIEGKTASPIFLLDEIDKVFRTANETDPLAPLHTYLEAEMAKNARDEFLELPFASDGVIWIAAANSLDGIAPSLVDRMLVLDVGAPGESQMQVVIAAIYAGIIAGYGGWFDLQLPANIIEKLATIHPRRVKRLLALACTRAASMGHRDISTGDIEAAQKLFAQQNQRQRAGFLA